MCMLKSLTELDDLTLLSGLLILPLSVIKLINTNKTDNKQRKAQDFKNIEILCVMQNNTSFLNGLKNTIKHKLIHILVSSGFPVKMCEVLCICTASNQPATHTNTMLPSGSILYGRTCVLSTASIFITFHFR